MAGLAIHREVSGRRPGKKKKKKAGIFLLLFIKKIGIEHCSGPLGRPFSAVSHQPVVEQVEVLFQQDSRLPLGREQHVRVYGGRGGHRIDRGRGHRRRRDQLLCRGTYRLRFDVGRGRTTALAVRARCPLHGAVWRRFR